MCGRRRGETGGDYGGRCLEIIKNWCEAVRKRSPPRTIRNEALTRRCPKSPMLASSVHLCPRIPPLSLSLLLLLTSDDLSLASTHAANRRRRLGQVRRVKCGEAPRHSEVLTRGSDRKGVAWGEKRTRGVAVDISLTGGARGEDFEEEGSSASSWRSIPFEGLFLRLKSYYSTMTRVPSTLYSIPSQRQ